MERYSDRSLAIIAGVLLLSALTLLVMSQFAAAPAMPSEPTPAAGEALSSAPQAAAEAVAEAQDAGLIGPPEPAVTATPAGGEEAAKTLDETELISPEVDLTPQATEPAALTTEDGQPIDPSFDPARPFRFCEGENCVDFLQPGHEFTFGMTFDAEQLAVSPVFPQPGASWEEYFPLCEPRLLVTNAKDGDSAEEVWYKSIIYLHSGRCRGDWLPGEYIRNYLEGGYFVPSEQQRAARLEEVVGQGLILDDGNGPVTFEIVDAIYLDEEQVVEYAEDPGSLDHFFTSGVQPGKHEIFVVFCGSIGPLRSGNPMDFFTSRYVLRLQVPAAGDAASSS